MEKMSYGQLLKHLLDTIEANHTTPHDNQKECGMCTLEMAILQEMIEHGLDVETKKEN